MAISEVPVLVNVCKPIEKTFAAVNVLAALSTGMFAASNEVAPVPPEVIANAVESVTAPVTASVLVNVVAPANTFRSDAPA